MGARARHEAHGVCSLAAHPAVRALIERQMAQANADCRRGAGEGVACCRASSIRAGRWPVTPTRKVNRPCLTAVERYGDLVIRCTPPTRNDASRPKWPRSQRRPAMRGRNSFYRRAAGGAWRARTRAGAGAVPHRHDSGHHGPLLRRLRAPPTRRIGLLQAGERAGGLNGHPVEITYEDDRGEPQRRRRRPRSRRTSIP